MRWRRPRAHAVVRSRPLRRQASVLFCTHTLAPSFAMKALHAIPIAKLYALVRLATTREGNAMLERRHSEMLSILSLYLYSAQHGLAR